MILLVDNYDSFVHNLARYFRRLGMETHVVRNDQLTTDDVRGAGWQAVVFSPGPGAPAQAGNGLQLVRDLAGDVPMLGVCLGHQILVEAMGGEIVRAARPLHGTASWLHHDGCCEFLGLPSPLRVGRYHSLVAAPGAIPSPLHISGWSEDQVILSVRHRELPLFGWQFHPESLLTPAGYELLAGFLREVGAQVGEIPTSEGTERPDPGRPEPHVVTTLSPHAITF